jgi:hypothetical protein
MQPRSTQSDLFEPLPKRLPDGLVYRPDFLSAVEESQLLAQIRELPLHEAQYKQFTARRRIASFRYIQSVNSTPTPNVVCRQL